MRFEIKEFVKGSKVIDGKYYYVDAEKKYFLNNRDDLKNWFLSQVDFSESPVRIEVNKIEEADNEQ